MLYSRPPFVCLSVIAAVVRTEDGVLETFVAREARSPHSRRYIHDLEGTCCCLTTFCFSVNLDGEGISHPLVQSFAPFLMIPTSCSRIQSIPPPSAVSGTRSISSS